MSYPLRAFREVFVPAVTGGTLVLAGVGSTTDQLSAGQLGVFTISEGIFGSAINAATTKDIFFGCGSYHTVENIAPGLGGYKMSDKSHVVPINGITRFWKKTAVAATPMVISVGWDQTVTGSTKQVGPTFQCGTFYRILLEAKGEAALRVFGHEVYRDAEAWTGCCGGNCQSGCTGQLVDAATVMLQWSDYIKQDPILSTMLAPKVYINGTLTGGVGSGVYTYNTDVKSQIYSAYDISIGLGAASGTYVPNTTATAGSVVAALQLTTAYVDTVFNNCTFTPSDYYYVDVLLIYASLRMDDGLSSDPCQVTTTINTSVPNMVTTITAPAQVSGLGEMVVRNWITYRRYLGENFPDGYEIDLFRMRQIEDDVTLANVTRSALYDEVHILYVNKDQFNPKPADNNRVWEVVFYVPTGTSTTTFTTLISNCLSTAGSNVTLESFT